VCDAGRTAIGTKNENFFSLVSQQKENKGDEEEIGERRRIEDKSKVFFMSLFLLVRVISDGLSKRREFDCCPLWVTSQSYKPIRRQ
jgi:hypothetical protein